MKQDKDIVLVVDYHPENMEIRQWDEATGQERRWRRPTGRRYILAVVEAARRVAEGRGGRVVWIMESTTGWARVHELIGTRTTFALINVLKMPKAPTEHRRKTDTLDTARALREYRNGSLPLAYLPSPWLRRVRRQVDTYQEMIARQTTLRNWIWQLLAHETWVSRENLWTPPGLARLRALAAALPESDGKAVTMRLEQLALLDRQVAQVQDDLMALYRDWPEAQRLDRVRGVAELTAVAMLAYIGPIGRFQESEQLIAYAGLAPGVHRSDGKGHALHIGGGGTHARLRYFVMQATRWLRTLPRYQPTWERVLARHGKKAARVAVGRSFLRSLYKMLRDDAEFSPGGVGAAADEKTTTTAVFREKETTDRRYTPGMRPTDRTRPDATLTGKDLRKT